MKISIATFLIFIACKVDTGKLQPPEDSTSKYTVKITESAYGGWGYQIFEDEKLLIDQVNIPAVAGNKGFISRVQAESVGRLVVQKLSSMPQDLPSVTIAELDSLKINY
ncbi:MAG: DUF4907 domain-containing protein [Bacteroidota bacterium]